MTHAVRRAAQRLPGGLRQRACRRIPVLGVLRHSGAHHVVDRARNARNEVGDSRRRSVDVREHDREQFALERFASGQRLVQDACQGVDVSALVAVLAADPFR